MVTLTIWIFPGPYDAGAVLRRLEKLCARELIRVGDGALISWPARRSVPILQPLTSLPRAWVLDDAFWGLLAAVLFRRPPTDVPCPDGATLGESLTALGASAAVLDTVRGQIVEGTSGLLLFVESEVARRIAWALDTLPYAMVEAPLTTGQEARLRATFGTLTG